jgi:hypothetical protein
VVPPKFRKQRPYRKAHSVRPWRRTFEGADQDSHSVIRVPEVQIRIEAGRTLPVATSLFLVGTLLAPFLDHLVEQ